MADFRRAAKIAAAESAEADNRPFFLKYWYLVLPALFFLVSLFALLFFFGFLYIASV